MLSLNMGLWLLFCLHFPSSCGNKSSKKKKKKKRKLLSFHLASLNLVNKALVHGPHAWSSLLTQNLLHLFLSQESLYRISPAGEKPLEWNLLVSRRSMFNLSVPGAQAKYEMW